MAVYRLRRPYGSLDKGTLVAPFPYHIYGLVIDGRHLAVQPVADKLSAFVRLARWVRSRLEQNQRARQHDKLFFIIVARADLETN